VCVALLGAGSGDVDPKVVATSTLLPLVSATTGSAWRSTTVTRCWAASRRRCRCGRFVLVLARRWPEINDEAFSRATGCVAIDERRRRRDGDLRHHGRARALRSRHRVDAGATPRRSASCS
jgi:hypothetical protein